MNAEMFPLLTRRLHWMCPLCDVAESSPVDNNIGPQFRPQRLAAPWATDSHTVHDCAAALGVLCEWATDAAVQLLAECDGARSTAQRWFRYHQIRKMLGLAFLTQRRSLPAETIDLAFADRSKLRCAIDAHRTWQRSATSQNGRGSGGHAT